MEKERVPTLIPRSHQEQKLGSVPDACRKLGVAEEPPPWTPVHFFRVNLSSSVLWEVHLKCCPHFSDGETGLQCQSSVTSLDS